MKVRWELGLTAREGTGFAILRGVIQVPASVDTECEDVPRAEGDQPSPHHFCPGTVLDTEDH